MKTLRAMLVRLVGLFRRKQHEAEMNDELRAHFDALVERNVAKGMSPDEARFAALRAFGGVEQIKERARDERRSVWGEQVLQEANCQIGFLTLRRHADPYVKNRSRARSYNSRMRWPDAAIFRAILAPSEPRVLSRERRLTKQSPHV